MVASSPFTLLALAASLMCAKAVPAPYGNFTENSVGNSTKSPGCKPNPPARHVTTLGPVLNPNTANESRQNISPEKQVSLNWGAQGNSLVNVSLSMSHPTVLLEEIDDIKTVACKPSSVTITFSQASSFDEAIAKWSRNGDFILVTNHLGDCDAANERGIFLTEKLFAHKGNLTIVASGEKTDINNAAEFAEITFSSVPVSNSKRETTWDDRGLTLSNALSIPAHTSLLQENPYLLVTADNADLSTHVTLSGKVRYSILHATLQELSFDVDGSAAASLGLTVDVKGSYKDTFSYAPTPLTYSLINVPGIISLGPALSFKIGADIGADAAVTVTTDLSAKLENGNFHVNFLDSSASSATGWTPVFSAVTNITERATAFIDPFVDITVELGFVLLGGLVDLSGGVTAQPRSNNDFTLTGTQELEGYVNGTTGSHRFTQPRGNSCAQGVSIKSEFQLSVIAFVTQWWKETVYTVTKPIVDECYSWL